MNSNLENAMAKQTEQATIQAMVESINNGMIPQGSATPDSNCSAEVQGVPVGEKTSGTATSGTVPSNPYLKKWDGIPLQPGILYHRNQMIGLPECCIMENRL